MKNLFFVAVGAIIIMLSACGKDATVNNTDQNSTTTTINQNIGDILGTWYYSTDTIKYYTGNTLDSTKTASYFSTDNITFTNAGTGTEVRGSVSSSFTYSVVNAVMELVFPTKPGGSTPTADGVVNTNGMRTLATDNTTIIADIKQLSATNMELQFTTVNGSQTSIETAYFVKQ
jgi:hypothetical protein